MSTKKSTQKTQSNGSSRFGLNKISMYVIVAVALLYVISLLLAVFNVNLIIVSALQGVATAIMITIVAILAWRYVRHKPAVWIILYIICLILVIVGIIVPLVV